MQNAIDWNMALTIGTAVTPFAAGFFMFLHKLDKKVSVIENDLKWLKLKSCQRRQEDFTQTEHEE